jgi:hypothetical protein
MDEKAKVLTRIFGRNYYRFIVNFRKLGRKIDHVGEIGNSPA